MKIVCIGGGPAGLYFAILMKKADPAHDVAVVERNRPDDTFGFGVVFSDATLEHFARGRSRDPRRDRGAFAHWDDIDIHYRGQRADLDGPRLLRPVAASAARHPAAPLRGASASTLEFETEVRDLDALPRRGPGARRRRRQQHDPRALRRALRPPDRLAPEPLRLARHDLPVPGVHLHLQGERARPLARARLPLRRARTRRSSSRRPRRPGAAPASTRRPRTTRSRSAEELFADELEGHRLLKNRSLWRNFPTVRNERWHHGNVVLVGDAAHTAHFSIGSGTKLAMEDAIALAQALAAPRRRPGGARGLRGGAAAGGREPAARGAGEPRVVRDTERYMAPRAAPVRVQPAHAQPARHAREPEGARSPVRRDGRSVVRRAAPRGRAASPLSTAPAPPPPPMFTPFRLRDLVLANRVVVSPMCQYSAEDGTPNDWHLVHLGSARDGRRGPGDRRDDRRQPRGAHQPGLHRHVQARARRRVEAHRRLRPRAHAGAGSAPARPRRAQGLDPADVGGDRRAARRGQLADHRGVAAFRTSRTARCRARWTAPTWTRCATSSCAPPGWPRRRASTCSSSTWRTATCSRASSRRSPTCAPTHYGGSLENRMRFPLEVFDAVRAAWPAGQADLGAHLGDGLGARRHRPPTTRSRSRRALQAHGCDIVDVSAGQTVPRPEAGLRPAVPDAVRRPDPPRGRHRRR